MSPTGKYTSQASLALIGQHFVRLGIWHAVEAQVKIKQKVIQHRPTDKLLDCLINLLAGGVGVVEANTTVRVDEVVQRAFGRQSCAEQSTISRTLNACDMSNVAQLRAAIVAILRQTSQSIQHDYASRPLVLDVDMMGLPTECHGEGVMKGYFSYHRGRRGRQLGRVCASQYGEVLVDRLYDGRRQLERCVLPLIDEAIQALNLVGCDAESPQKQVIVRMDAGGGSAENINGLMLRGYAVLTKLHSWRCAYKLISSVTQWIPDPKMAQRQVGWVNLAYPYARPTRQLAIRCIDEKGKQHQTVLISNLTESQLGTLLQQSLQPGVLQQMPWLLLHAYDGRSGGVETQNRNARQGLGLTQHCQHSYAAQEMMLLLDQLAHNFTILIRNELSRVDDRFVHYATKRMIRDVFHISGRVLLKDNHLIHASLNRKHPFSAAVRTAFCRPYV